MINTKKILATILGCCCFFIVQAQDTVIVMVDTVRLVDDSTAIPVIENDRPVFKDYPAFNKKYFYSFQHFVPARWQVKDSVQADLNGDLLTDIVMILEYDTIANEVFSEVGGTTYWDWDANPRVLIILFANKQHRYRLALQNNLVIGRAGMGFKGGDPFEELVVKNRVITLPDSNGDDYQFRFQNGDFYLIGATTEGFYGEGREYMYAVSANFLTSKAKFVLTPFRDADENKRIITRWIKLEKHPLKKLSAMKNTSFELIENELYNYIADD